MDDFFFKKELSTRQKQLKTREEELKKQKGLENHVWKPEELGWLEILNYSVRTPPDSRDQFMACLIDAGKCALS